MPQYNKWRREQNKKEVEKKMKAAWRNTNQAVASMQAWLMERNQIKEKEGAASQVEGYDKGERMTGPDWRDVFMEEEEEEVEKQAESEADTEEQ